jgi:hypothetical protein
MSSLKEVEEAVVECDRHAGVGQVLLIEPFDRFREGEDTVAKVAKASKAAFQMFGADVQPRFPFVLIVNGDTVVGENQQAPLAPPAGFDAIEASRPAYA